MSVKRMIFIIVVISVVTAVMLSLSILAVDSTFGVKTQTIYFDEMSSDIRQDICASLGIENASELRLLTYGGPDKFYEYAVVVSCDDTDGYLAAHPFLAANFTDMGDKRTLFHADVDDAGYFSERGNMIIAVDKRDYHRLEEQNELTRRLGDFNAAAQKAFENTEPEE